MTDDLANYLAGGAESKHPLDRFTQKVITNLLMHYCIPWLTSCLQKYPESYFHQKMVDPRWDFIADWKLNHADKYPKFIAGARKLRHRFTFDTDAVTDRVVNSIKLKAGWTIHPYEYILLRDVVDRVRQEIYS